LVTEVSEVVVRFGSFRQRGELAAVRTGRSLFPVNTFRLSIFHEAYPQMTPPSKMSGHRMTLRYTSSANRADCHCDQDCTENIEDTGVFYIRLLYRGPIRMNSLSDARGCEAPHSAAGPAACSVYDGWGDQTKGVTTEPLSLTLITWLPTKSLQNRLSVTISSLSLVPLASGVFNNRDAASGVFVPWGIVSFPHFVVSS
jgi:hypothetical protein